MLNKLNKIFNSYIIIIKALSSAARLKGRMRVKPGFHVRIITDYSE